MVAEGNRLLLLMHRHRERITIWTAPTRRVDMQRTPTSMHFYWRCGIRPWPAAFLMRPEILT